MPTKKTDSKAAAKKGGKGEPEKSKGKAEDGKKQKDDKKDAKDDKKAAKEDKKKGKDDKKGGKKEAAPSGKGKDDGKKGKDKGKGKKAIASDEDEDSEVDLLKNEEDEELSEGEDEERDDGSGSDEEDDRGKQGKGKGAKATKEKKGKSKSKYASEDEDEYDEEKSEEDEEDEDDSEDEEDRRKRKKKEKEQQKKAKEKTEAEGKGKKGKKDGKASKRPTESIRSKRGLKSTSRLFMKFSGFKRKRNSRHLNSASRLFWGLGKRKQRLARKKKQRSVLKNTSKFMMRFKASKKKKIAEKAKKAENESGRKTSYMLIRLGGGKSESSGKKGGFFKGLFRKSPPGAFFQSYSRVLGKIAGASNWLTKRFLSTKGKQNSARGNSNWTSRRSKKYPHHSDENFYEHQTDVRSHGYYNDGFEHDEDEYDEDEYDYDDEYYDPERYYDPFQRRSGRQELLYSPYGNNTEYYDDPSYDDNYCDQEDYGYEYDYPMQYENGYEDYGDGMDYDYEPFEAQDQYEYVDEMDYYTYGQQDPNAYAYYDYDVETYDEAQYTAGAGYGFSGNEMEFYEEGYPTNPYDYPEVQQAYMTPYGDADPYMNYSEDLYYQDHQFNYSENESLPYLQSAYDIYQPYPYFMEGTMEQDEAQGVYSDEFGNYSVNDMGVQNSMQFRLPRPQVKLFGKEKLDVPFPPLPLPEMLEEQYEDTPMFPPPHTTDIVPNVHQHLQRPLSPTPTARIIQQANCPTPSRRSPVLSRSPQITSSPIPQVRSFPPQQSASPSPSRRSVKIMGSPQLSRPLSPLAPTIQFGKQSGVMSRFDQPVEMPLQNVSPLPLRRSPLASPQLPMRQTPMFPRKTLSAQPSLDTLQPIETPLRNASPLPLRRSPLPSSQFSMRQANIPPRRRILLGQPAIDTLQAYPDEMEVQFPQRPNRGTFSQPSLNNNAQMPTSPLSMRKYSPPPSPQVLRNGFISQPSLGQRSPSPQSQRQMFGFNRQQTSQISRKHIPLSQSPPSSPQGLVKSPHSSPQPSIRQNSHRAIPNNGPFSKAGGGMPMHHGSIRQSPSPPPQASISRRSPSSPQPSIRQDARQGIPHKGPFDRFDGRRPADHHSMRQSPSPSRRASIRRSPPPSPRASVKRSQPPSPRASVRRSPPTSPRASVRRRPPPSPQLSIRQNTVRTMTHNGPFDQFNERTSSHHPSVRRSPPPSPQGLVQRSPLHFEQLSVIQNMQGTLPHNGPIRHFGGRTPSGHPTSPPPLNQMCSPPSPQQTMRRTGSFRTTETERTPSPITFQRAPPSPTHQSNRAPVSPHLPAKQRPHSPSPSGRNLSDVQNVPTSKSATGIRGSRRSKIPMGTVKPSTVYPYMQKMNAPIIQNVPPFRSLERSAISAGPGALDSPSTPGPIPRHGPYPGGIKVLPQGIPIPLKSIHEHPLALSPQNLSPRHSIRKSYSEGCNNQIPPSPQLPLKRKGPPSPQPSVRHLSSRSSSPHPSLKHTTPLPARSPSPKRVSSPVLTNALQNPQLRNASYKSPFPGCNDVYSPVMTDFQQTTEQGPPTLLKNALQNPHVRYASYVTPFQPGLSYPPTVPFNQTRTSPLLSNALQNPHLHNANYRMPLWGNTSPYAPLVQEYVHQTEQMPSPLLSSALQNNQFQNNSFRSSLQQNMCHYSPEMTMYSQTQHYPPSLLNNALQNAHLRNVSYASVLQGFPSPYSTAGAPYSQPVEDLSSPLLADALQNPQVRNASYKSPLMRSQHGTHMDQTASPLLSAALQNPHLHNVSYRLPDESVLSQHFQKSRQQARSPLLASALQNPELREASYKLPERSILSRNLRKQYISSPHLAEALQNPHLRNVSYRLPGGSVLSTKHKIPTPLLSTALKNSNIQGVSFKLPPSIQSMKQPPTSSQASLPFLSEALQNPGLRNAFSSGTVQYLSPFAMVMPQRQDTASSSFQHEHWAQAHTRTVPEGEDVWSSERVLPHHTVQNLQKWSMYRDGCLMDSLIPVTTGQKVSPVKPEWAPDREGESRGRWYDKVIVVVCFKYK